MKIVSRLPRTPGVYLFYGQKGELLYIGKATYLRDRVRSYFSGRDERGERIFNMVSQVVMIKVQKTESVLEALILEANLIKKHQPKYNVDLKDDKSFSYFAITKQKFPKVLILRETDIDKKIHNISDPMHYTKLFGPYTSKKNMELALGIIRKIFPFHSGKADTEKGCLDFQIGRCPGPYAGRITEKDYRKNIMGIQMILGGRKKSLVKTLEKEMRQSAKKHDFEKAAELRNKVFALNHIRDIALIGNEKKFNLPTSGKNLRIEAYDISNISGKNATGSMVVFNGAGPDKAQYRKFKIRTIDQADDVGMMREILSRRFNNDWPKPDLILLDGGAGHLNMGREVLRSFKSAIPMVAVAKGETRKNNEIILGDYRPKAEIKAILDNVGLVKRIMDEAHRFAIVYHKKLRKKNFIR